ncbi:hypothetical protein O3M35_006308 [Rhynocoris fuscipes]|uniref:Uncharacterized protein n=1 Tax=Rhynocoris fuscipes TaxID=488301 RepID=A0AAW1DEJ1_9HEMI
MAFATPPCDHLETILSGERSKELKVKYVYADPDEVALRLIHELLVKAKNIIEEKFDYLQVIIPTRINWPMISEFNVFNGQAYIEKYIASLQWSPKWCIGIKLHEIRESGFTTNYIYNVTWSVRHRATPINQYYLNTYFVFEICNLYPTWAKVMVKIYIEDVDMVFRPHDAKFSEYFIISQIQNKYIYNDVWER